MKIQSQLQTINFRLHFHE